MFTALHTETNGDQMLYECERVYFTPNGIADGPNGPVRDQPGVYLLLTKGQDASRVHIGLCQARSTMERANPSVIVMNQYGKTVAKYDL
jgi:hypothetical protein